jgi:Phosphopantetheine attachment site
VRAVVAEALRLSNDSISTSADLFQEFGADSLVATKIRNVITAALCSSSSSGGKIKKTSIPNNLVYFHSSVNALSTAVLELAEGRDASASDSGVAHAAREKTLNDLIAKYSGNWPKRPEQLANGMNGHWQGGYAVLVTGVSARELPTNENDID